MASSEHKFPRIAVLLLVTATAVGIAIPAGARAATTVYTYSADLDADWGGPLDQSGPAILSATVASTANGLTLSDSLNSGAAGVIVASSPVAPNSFAFEYTFTVSTPSALDGTYASQLTTGQLNPLGALGFDLYLGADPTLFQGAASSTPVATGAANGGASGGEVTLGYADLAANQVYTLVVTGALAGRGPASFIGAAQVSAVPLPGALSMFVAGLAALALFGAGDKARKLRRFWASHFAAPVTKTKG